MGVCSVEWDVECVCEVWVCVEWVVTNGYKFTQ